MSCDWSCHNRLYRDPDNGKIAGVCAGLADYFSWNVDAVRFATIVAAILFSVTTVALYTAAAFFLPLVASPFIALACTAVLHGILQNYNSLL